MVDHNDEFGSSAPPPEGGSENPYYGEPNPEAAVGDPSSPPGESFGGPGGYEAPHTHSQPVPHTFLKTSGNG